ncbi:ORF_069L [Scale drop disease virus]|uniref:ORF_069L n=2 Tax=Scale drop disease virus TaxID=1697349 RepID=A0A0K1L6I5_9VIRU|nr:ORF_069L [Scale drop disease virus]AKU37484.1 ORF_069L [Scale drop disease virus]
MLCIKMNSETILWDTLAQNLQLCEKYPIIRGYIAQLKTGQDSGASFKRYWAKRKNSLLQGEVSKEYDNFETAKGINIDMGTVFKHCPNIMECLISYDKTLSSMEIPDDKIQSLASLIDSSPVLSQHMSKALNSELMVDITKMLQETSDPNPLTVTMACLEKHKDYVQNLGSELMDTLNEMPPEELNQLINNIKDLTDGDEVIQSIVGNM